MKRLIAALALAAALACAKDRSPNRLPPGSGPLVAVYKVAVDADRVAARGAKVSVWAQEPDRLHAEVVAPVGGVAFTLDAGGGRVCLVDVARGIAYAGEDDGAALDALLGLPLSVAETVAALLRGVAPAGLTVTREGDEDGALPSNLRLANGARFVTLSRVRVDRARIDAALLGTGVPPAHLPVQPLADAKAALERER